MDIFTPHEIYGMAAEFFGIDPEIIEEAARRTNSKPHPFAIDVGNHIYNIYIDSQDDRYFYFNMTDEKGGALFRASGIRERIRITRLTPEHHNLLTFLGVDIQTYHNKSGSLNILKQVFLPTRFDVLSHTEFDPYTKKRDVYYKLTFNNSKEVHFRPDKSVKKLISEIIRKSGNDPVIIERMEQYLEQRELVDIYEARQALREEDSSENIPALVLNIVHDQSELLQRRKNW